ncbi:polyhydroxyalkanoate synthesis repressor PhaR, partial [Cereibacter sphaeroides]|nr:polyhydroxyalkanoate synthesis repressor PhaR [Cereibacter sphaeroides]
SFEMLRTGQTKMMENLSQMPNPMVGMPGFEVMRKQQEAFLKTMMGLQAWNTPSSDKEEPPAAAPGSADELAQIRKQLAELQKKLSKL